jgi:hypothetical protein
LEDRKADLEAEIASNRARIEIPDDEGTETRAASVD